MLYQSNHFGISQYFCKEYGENFNFPVHLHESFELITVLSGEMNVTVGDTEYLLKKGEAVLVFPNQLHSMTSKKSRHMLCIFSGEIIKAFAVKTAGKVPNDSKFMIDRYLVDALNNVSESASVIEKKGILYSVCSEFDKGAKYEEKTEFDSGILDKVFRFVEENYGKDCSLKNIYDDIGYSYSYISRFFKKTTGISLNTYINKYRIGKACYILTNTNTSVLECAMECGYESLRSFNRNFITHTGKTPTEYREQAKKTE